MPNSIRQLYVMTNRTIPGMVKVGLTTVGVVNRSVGLSSGLPSPFEVYGNVDFPDFSEDELRKVEQVAHKRLSEHRYSKDREFFTVSPDQAMKVLHEIRVESIQYKSQGLSVLGDARQPSLPQTPPAKTRAQRIAEERKDARLDEKARTHWHVWVESERGDDEQVVTLALVNRHYWSKSGAVGRVKREVNHQIHAVAVQCQDSACPAYGKRRTEV